MSSQRTSPPPTQTFYILYAALFATTFVYFGLLVSGALDTPEVSGELTLVIAMAVSAGGVTAVSWFLPAKFHRLGVEALELRVEEVPDPNGSVMFRDNAPKIRVFGNASRAKSEARRVYFTPFILRLAMNEAVAMFGFTLGIMGFALAFVIPFFALSWGLFVLAAPRPARWLDPVAARFDAQFAER